MNSVDAGIDVIAHLEFLVPGQVMESGGNGPTGMPTYDERVGEAVAASGAWLDLNPQSSGWDTLAELRRREVDHGLLDPERRQVDALGRYFEAMLHVISGLRELGLVDRMAFGSDAGPYDTEFGRADLNVELARLSGLTPMESLQVLTRNAARVCGIGDEVGVVRRGLRADLLVLAEDPLKAPEAMRTVAGVYRSGWRVSERAPGFERFCRDRDHPGRSACHKVSGRSGPASQTQSEGAPASDLILEDASRSLDVSTDLAMVRRRLAEHVRKLAWELTGLPSDAVPVNASFNHGAPTV